MLIEALRAAPFFQSRHDLGRHLQGEVLVKVYAAGLNPGEGLLLPAYVRTW